MKNLLSGLLFLGGATCFVACQKSHDLSAPTDATNEIRTSTAGEVGMESTVSDCGQFRTQSQGGWGTNPAGGNPGTYLHAHFATAFPGGLSVGCTSGHTVYYSTADAVTEFLPAGGSPAVLATDATNPGAKSIKNVLIGQVTALALSVGFDYADPSFAPAEDNLANLVIVSGPFAGKSVSEFLVIANDVLGGCNTSYTPDAINETASSINANFLDGTMDGGFLTCPTPRFER